MAQIKFKLLKQIEKLNKGTSRFWGNPDLHSVEDYPCYIDSDGDKVPYTFICQINLEDIADIDVDNLLPHTGLLSVFAKVDYYLGYITDDFIGSAISDADDVKVIYHPDYSSFDEVIVVDADGNSISPDELAITFGESDAIEDHALFPLSTHRPWETWDSPYEDWITLLQIDSCEGADFNLNFMDCGVLNILISSIDLKNKNFDNIRAIVLSS